MAFVNQFQPVVFRTEKVKVLKVIGEVDNVNETGFRFLLPGELTGAAVVIVDPATGAITIDGTAALASDIRVVPTAVQPITNAGIQTGTQKITNAMNVAVDLYFGNLQLNTPGTPIVVTVQGEVGTPFTVEPTDIIQKHDIEFEQGIVSTTTQATAPGLQLFVAVNLCVVVARETIMKINGYELFCR